jgi:hypothetical protein
MLLGGMMLGAMTGCMKEKPEVITPVTKPVFSGFVQKGPYNNGSSITITPLDGNLNQTGTVFSTQIIDNAGNFGQKNIEFASNFIELKADGYYFNEVKGETSSGSLTLYALADISDVNSVNINVLTHLERQRIIYLKQNDGLSFLAAKKQARSEVLNIFKFTLPDGVAAESLNITDNALLLAVSVIVQGQLSTGDMSELLANISSDIRTDGKLKNLILWEQLMNNVAYLDLEQVVTNLEKKYSGLGITVNINGAELKSYIEQFKNNSGVEQTLSFTYPEKGKYGLNILADGFVEAQKTEWGRFEYSVRAEVPAGNSSLKIVIKSPTNSEWGGWNQGSGENWIVSNVGNQFTCTVFESGKPADASVIFTGDCIIEYYENGAIEPTKIKEVKVIDYEVPEENNQIEISTIINNWKLLKVTTPFTPVGPITYDYSPYNIIYEFKTNDILIVSGKIDNFEMYRGHVPDTYYYSINKDDKGGIWLKINNMTFGCSISSKELNFNNVPLDGYLYYLVKIN